ncbi:MAG: peptidylprolyl isomerase [Acidobacteriota bacterium]|nr:peptidylprolyl isomerase [Acidobacteriota bacterium]
MNVRFTGLVCALSAALWAQTPPPPQPEPKKEIPPDTVVATIGDKRLTANDVKLLVAGVPPQYQQAFRTDPVKVLEFIFVQRYLAEEAEKAGYDKLPQYKEALEYQRRDLLSRAEIQEKRNRIPITTEAEEQYYKEHPEKYKQANVKVIYVAYNPNTKAPVDPKAPKLHSEEEAKAIIEDLRKQVLSGADFGAVAKAKSEDKESADRNGDFGVIGRGGAYPEEIKKAVFALKAGEVSEPIKQRNGYYLIKVESLTVQTYNQVQAEINEEMKGAAFDAWFKGIQKQNQVKIENADFFKPQAVPRLPQAPAR